MELTEKIKDFLENTPLYTPKSFEGGRLSLRALKILEIGLSRMDSKKNQIVANALLIESM